METEVRESEAVDSTTASASLIQINKNTIHKNSEATGVIFSVALIA